MISHSQTELISAQNVKECIFRLFPLRLSATHCINWPLPVLGLKSVSVGIC